MADYETEFLDACRAAAERFARNSPPDRWQGAGQKSIQGWFAGYIPSRDGQDGPWKLVYEKRHVLSVDGEIYEYTRSWKELQESPWTSTDIEYRLYKVPMSILVGSSGNPFEEWKAKVARLGY